jgi:hypothetical protein
MTIDMTEINKEIINEREDLAEKEKEFAKKVMALKERYAKKAKAEIDPILKKYAEIEAIKIMRLYKRYFMVGGEK